MRQTRTPIRGDTYLLFGGAALIMAILLWLATSEPAAGLMMAALLGLALTVSTLIMDRLGLVPPDGGLSMLERKLLRLAAWSAAGSAIVILVIAAALQTPTLLLIAVPVPVLSGAAAVVLMARSEGFRER